MLGIKNKTQVQKRDQSLWVGPKPKGRNPLKLTQVQLNNQLLIIRK